MTTAHVSGSFDLRTVLDTADPGDTIKCHAGVYDALNSYQDRIVGGATWATRTRIEAYQRTGQPRDRVVFRGGDLAPIILARNVNRNLEIIGCVFDGERRSTHAAKVTYTSSGEVARSIRFTDCEFTGAVHSGLLATGCYDVSVIGGSSHHNGSVIGLDHGLYLACDDVLVRGHDSYENVGSGIIVYNGGAPSERGVVEYCRAWDNGRAGRGAGILLAGIDHLARRNMVWGNHVGLQLYGDALNCRWLNNTTDARQPYPFHVSSTALGTSEQGTQIILRAPEDQPTP